MDHKSPVAQQDLLTVQTVLAAVVYILRPVVLLVYYIALYLAIAVVSLAKLLYAPIGFLLQPVVYLLRFLLACTLTPFRLLTLYIYLGIAALIGLGIGLAMRYLYQSLTGALHLDRTTQLPPARSAKEYREAKLWKKEQAFAPNLTSATHSPGQLSSAYFSTSDGMSKTRRGKGLLDQTITEEMESDY
ncbi:hypothetical protein LTR62_005248 [Meristemomyces frigidus]|uniref:Uncharacterized protein n=1 Tax=Meristemomyces frigidus TaxID=1508187 RepID=A0AAN7TH23_9PEZI|nr:hypothetical protein LTR62_005248 [Meristemomyces frigidus]